MNLLIFMCAMTNQILTSRVTTECLCDCFDKLRDQSNNPLMVLHMSKLVIHP